MVFRWHSQQHTRRQVKHSDLHVILAYKNFASHKNISHIGLGVSAQLTAKFLNNYGIRAQVRCLANPDADIRQVIDDNKQAGYPVTHVVVSAPWVPTAVYAGLCRDFPFIHFAMCCHSNCGFLQADANGARLFRESLALEQGTHNFHSTGNSAKFCEWVEAAYRSPCKLLPNLYYLEPLGDPTRPGWPTTGGVLRIMIPGAQRAQKNIITMVCACVEIATTLKAQTEIWMSTAREDDQAARMIMAAAIALTENLPNVTLVPLPWASWPDFRKYVANMHLMMQVSYTESHNLCVADGCAEGIPSVISSAIDWAPSQWIAEVDDTRDVARVGMGLIANPIAGRIGNASLQAHNAMGGMAWERFLSNTRP